MTEYVPPGYEIVEDRIKNTETDNWFFIRNRSFEEIDHTFRHLPSKLITQFIRLPHKGQVKVLDVGGGTKSASTKQIAEKYGPGVIVVNADLIPGCEDKPPNLHTVSADMIHLPFADKTFNFIYSRQVLTYFAPKNQEDPDFIKERNVLLEIARVLSEGGIAVIDEEYFSRLPTDHPQFQALCHDLSVSIDQKETGLFLSLEERLQRVLDPESFPRGKFIVMKKYPLDHSIQKVIKDISFTLSSWRLT